MDYFTLRRHVCELAETFSEKPIVVRAISMNGRSLALLLKCRGSKWGNLVLNLDNPEQGLRLADKISEIEKNTSIVRTINRVLINSRLISVSMTGNDTNAIFDRVVKLHFVSIDSYFGNRSDFYILCEFTGRIADIFICDSDLKVLDRLSRTSNNLIGAVYSQIDSPLLHNPLTVNSDFLSQIFEAPESQWKEHIGGLSPLFINELVYRAGRNCEDIKEDNQLFSMSSILTTTFRGLTNEVYIDKTSYIYTQKGKFKAISCFRLTSPDFEQIGVFKSVNEAANWLSDNISAPRRINDLKKRCLAVINRKFHRKQDLLQDQKKLLGRYQNFAHYKHVGELLIANLYRIKPRMKSVEIDDWETGQKIKIDLEPNRTPSFQAQKYFNQFKKAQRGVIQVERRIIELTDDISWLHEQRWLTEVAQNEGDLQTDILSTSERDSGKKKKVISNIGRGKIKLRFEPILEIDGCRYYAGRNAKQNHQLTFQFAKKGDYWFHANDVPGSHIILKKAEGEVVEVDIFRGALLAGWLSFSRESSKVAVDYTDVAFVKKIPGGDLGRVNYTNQKTAFIAPQQAASLLT